MTDYLLFGMLLCSRGEIIFALLDWSIWDNSRYVVANIFTTKIFFESPSYKTGLHQTCLSLPSDVAVSPFQNSNGLTWSRALCKGKDLVRMSAGLSPVGMCSNRTILTATTSLTL